MNSEAETKDSPSTAEGIAIDKTLPILLVCDLQSRFKAAMPTFDHVATTAAKMISAASILNFRVVLSEQKPEVFGASVPELGLANLNSNLHLGTFSKSKFSMVIPEIAELLKREAAEKSSLGGPTPIVIMGIEAHICVQQTALQLVQLGYEVYVLADGVSSIHHAGEVPIALNRMRQSGVLVTTSESFLFNAMGDASRAEFKAFAKLIKEAKAGTEGALGGLLSF